MLDHAVRHYTLITGQNQCVAGVGYHDHLDIQGYTVTDRMRNYDNFQKAVGCSTKIYSQFPTKLKYPQNVVLHSHGNISKYDNMFIRDVRYFHEEHQDYYIENNPPLCLNTEKGIIQPGENEISVSDLCEILNNYKSSSQSSRFFSSKPGPELAALHTLLNGKSDNDTITIKQIDQAIRKCSGLRSRSHRVELLYDPDKHPDDKTRVSNIIRAIGRYLAAKSPAIEQAVSAQSVG